MKALEGVKVLDFTHAYSAVYTGQVLGDLGADVLKIEPIGGEQSRQWPPYDYDNEKRSCYYTCFNRNRRAISMNLKSKEGLEIAYELVKDADVLLVNMRNGAMDKLGLGYEDLKKINPKLIYATINGYGSRGPFSPLKAYDNICTAYSGIMYSIGQEEQPPMKLGISIGDNYSGLTMASSVLMALVHQRKTGEGQLVEIAMQDSLFGLIDKQILDYSLTSEEPKRVGNAHTMYAPEDVYRAKGSDEYVTLSVRNEADWVKFCNTANKAEWISDARFATNELRKANYAELKPLIAQIFADVDKIESQEKFMQAGVPCAASYRVSDILDDPQFRERYMIRYQPDVQVGSMLTCGNPMKFSDTVCEEIKTSKFAGQDNEEVLHDLGYTDEEIKKLYEDKAIYQKVGKFAI